MMYIGSYKRARSRGRRFGHVTKIGWDKRSSMGNVEVGGNGCKDRERQLIDSETASRYGYEKRSLMGE